MNLSCEICTEPYNQQRRKQLSCTTCSLHACVSCHERYNLDSGLEPHCMQCKKNWDTEFMVSQFSWTVLNRFKKHKEQKLIQFEKTYIPETQLYLQYDTHVRTILKDNLEFQEKKIAGLLKEKTQITVRNSVYRNLVHSIINVKSQINLIISHINNWNYHLQMTDYDKIPEALRVTNSHFENKSKKLYIEFVHPCTSDSCNGFVMLSDWKCGVCSTASCKHGHRSRESVGHSVGHSCHDNDVKTAKLIMETSRPCPSCATRIHKISGCDQMWCTLCNTPFSWNTGKIETGAVHNPHFFEWFQNITEDEQRRTLQNGQCEGIPEYYHVIRHCRVVFERTSEYMSRFFITLYRLSVHIQQVEIEKLNHKLQFNNLDIRLKWLKNKIDDKHFGELLYKRNKKTSVNHRCIQVFELFNTLTNDLFHRLLHINETNGGESIIEEFLLVISYTNNCFANLYQLYKIQMPNIRLVNPTTKDVEFHTLSNGSIPLIKY